jgi:toxin CcdB
MDVLTPVVQFDEETFVLMKPQISAIPVRSIQDSVGSLAHYRTEIIAALDFALTGY